MIMSSFTELTDILGKENAKENVPMSGLTTFGAGGNCRYYLTPGSRAELSKALSVLKKDGIPWLILGRGSNVLVSDKGYPGAVISLRKRMNRIGRYVVSGNVFRCDAGALLSSVAKEACLAGLTGFEFASGIPGTIGGALIMNAGAYGGEMASVVKEADILLPDGEIRTLQKEELKLSYRHSVIPSIGGVVLSVTIELAPGDPVRIRETMDTLSEKRREKQPLEYGSAGSAFKRPEGYFAAALIEEAGLKGFTIGNAGVSSKHSGFIVNYGNATASEIYRVFREVQKTVLLKKGVFLEPEVCFLGEFEED